MKARASLCRNRKRVSSTSDGAEAFVVLAHDSAAEVEGRPRSMASCRRARREQGELEEPQCGRVMAIQTLSIQALRESTDELGLKGCMHSL